MNISLLPILHCKTSNINQDCQRVGLHQPCTSKVLNGVWLAQKFLCGFLFVSTMVYFVCMAYSITHRSCQWDLISVGTGKKKVFCWFFSHFLPFAEVRSISARYPRQKPVLRHVLASPPAPGWTQESSWEHLVTLPSETTLFWWESWEGRGLPNSQMSVRAKPPLWYNRF